MGNSGVMRLEQQTVLANFAFPELGRPTYIATHKNLLAVASEFPSLQWSGRDINDHRDRRYRVAMYRIDTLERIGVFDASRFDINHLSFHPDQPLIAISTGSYDGGYLYEGDLFFWNYDTGQHASVLDENREVVVCQLGESDVRIILKPISDEGEELDGKHLLLEAHLDNPTIALPERGIQVSALNFQRSIHNDMHAGYVRQSGDDIRNKLAEIATAAGQQFEERWHIWDVAWSEHERIMAVGGGIALEIWDKFGRRVTRMDSEIDGVQLLPLPNRKEVLVNQFNGGWTSESRVERISMDTWKRECIEGLSFFKCLSIASSGHVLSRDCGGPFEEVRNTQDRVLDINGSISRPLKLGHYDLFNHYMRVDGAPELYFLRGRRKSSHKNKWVCSLDPKSHKVKRLFPLEWNTKRKAHLFGGPAAFVPSNDTPSLILETCVYDCRGIHDQGSKIARRALPNGEIYWERSFDYPATALIVLKEPQVVVAAFNNGHLAIMDLSVGTLLWDNPVIIDGVRTDVLSLAANSNQVAAGTVDGRIIIFNISK